MSDQNDDLLAALAALMEQSREEKATQSAQGTVAASTPDSEPPKAEDFEDRLKACERLANQ